MAELPQKRPGIRVARERDPRRLRLVQVFLIFTFVALAFVLPTYLQHLAEGVAAPTDQLLSEMVGWYLWMLFVPVAWWTVRRFPLDRQHWKKRIWIYLASGVAVGLAYLVLNHIKTSLVHILVTGTPFPNLFSLGTGYVLGGLEFHLLVYSAMLGVAHAFEYHARYRDHQLRSSLLTAQLTQAQLEVLRVQLNPHFLFNTLNAISALMHRDVDAADSMLIQLSDFLRLTLDQGAEQEIPLASEINMLERYVAIEKTRFGDRLQVNFDIEDEVQDALVPSLLLQPLVENAIRHGIAVRSAPGEISIRARSQFPSRIELQVVDNGPGITGDPSKALRPGVGLHNSMARVEQLYGENQRFEISNHPRTGGVEVLISFPFRTQETYAGAEEQSGSLEPSMA